MIIRVTDLGGRRRLVDSDLIEGVRSVPDTIVTFLDGKSVIVREPAKELVSQIRGDRRAKPTRKERYRA